MAGTDTGREIKELRDEVFRLAESLAREAPRSGPTTDAHEAATLLQSVAYQLGAVERCLGKPTLRAVRGKLTAA
jgi:hypothetical protein